MPNELELWQFIERRLINGERVMLLVVGESTGSSPGRQGFKMAVGSDGELVGSIGGGAMEVNLVEQSREFLSNPLVLSSKSFLKPQTHKKNSPNSSGMICSGKQSIIFKQLDPKDLPSVRQAIDSLSSNRHYILTIAADNFTVLPLQSEERDGGFVFEKRADSDFWYQERLGPKNDLYIVGGGHCALALSQLMSTMDFYIRVFDDRSGLNTMEENRFANEKHLITDYERIGQLIEPDPQGYVVVMTLGYLSDELVIKQLINKEFEYFGVLGSKAKMAKVLKNLETDDIPAELLEKIRTPIGLPINSHTPEEIAVSIAAEIISVRNSDKPAVKKTLL